MNYVDATTGNPDRRTPWSEPVTDLWPSRPAWMADGLCVGLDTAFFYPHRGEDTMRAKRICAACPIKSACLDYALEQNEKFGIWGGTSERERRRMRRARKAA